MWKCYFKFVKLKPGKVVTSLYGEIDFSADNIGIEIIKTLYESDFPYLEITNEGKAELYGLDNSLSREVSNHRPKRMKSRILPII